MSTPDHIIADVFDWGPATGQAAVEALWEAGYEVRLRTEREEQTTIVETVLDGLRNVDHAVLDERYELDSMYRDLMMAVLPLGRLHAFAHMYESSEWGNVWDEVRQEVLEPSEVIVNHWTTGVPNYASKEGNQAEATTDPPTCDGSGWVPSEATSFARNRHCPGCPKCPPCPTCGTVGGGGWADKAAYLKGHTRCPDCGTGDDDVSAPSEPCPFWENGEHIYDDVDGRCGCGAWPPAAPSAPEGDDPR